MTKTLILLGILLLLVVAVRLFEIFARKKKSDFEYSCQNSIMTPAEHECFNAVLSEMGADYYFFPQVHLDAIVRPVDSNRSFAAFSHINQKSVDFVACDKITLRPTFVVEVDDKTHSRPKRMERDKEVERILHSAGIPLIRLQNKGRFDSKAVAQTVQEMIAQFAPTAQE